MNYEEYRELLDEALSLDKEFSTVILPIELQPGESQEDGIIRYLLENDLIEENGRDWKIKDRDKMREFNANLLKLLDTRIMASLMAEMDSLIEMGFVFMTADEHGNIIYELTEEGKEYVGDD